MMMNPSRKRLTGASPLGDSRPVPGDLIAWSGRCPSTGQTSTAVLSIEPRIGTYMMSELFWVDPGTPLLVLGRIDQVDCIQLMVLAPAQARVGWTWDDTNHRSRFNMLMKKTEVIR